MKKGVLVSIMLMICIAICACSDNNVENTTSPDDTSEISNSSGDNVQNSNEGSEVTVSSQELNDFDNIAKSPLTSTEHSLSDITKIMYYEYYEEQNHNQIAIDIGNKNLYTYPDIVHIRLDDPDYTMTDEDVETVQSLIDKYNVLKWDSTYGYKPDYDQCEVEDGGGSWRLYIQYTDGTVSRAKGYGYYSKSHPEGAESFIKEMLTFTHSKKEAE